MFNKEVLARLGQVNRRRTPMSERREVGTPGESPMVKDRSTPNPDEDLSQLSAGEEVATRWGTHWIRRRPLSELWPRADGWLRQALERLGPCRKVPPIESGELGALRKSFPERVVYLDLETCGFAGSMVFMVGLIHWCNNRFQLDQLMARNYAEEKAMLQTLWSIVAEQQVLVTFNGKSFDWPMVHDRSTMHHLGREARFAAENGSMASSPGGTHDFNMLDGDDPRPEPIHCDLLHHARRRWKDKLPDCKLQTLERYVCRRRRTADIPGREIPSAYHDFVRSGDAWLIRAVLHHNALDLVTLLQLSMLLLPATHSGPRKGQDERQPDQVK